MPANVDVVQLCPLKTTTLLWRPARGAPVLTIICKATYELKNGVTELAEVQDDVNERDLHKENNPKLGLHSASDMAPYKVRADVTLVGRVFAPRRELARSLVARLCVGSVDKRVEVHAERFLTSSGRVIDDKFFSKMSVGYERAAGGPDTPNPVGRSRGATPDTTGRVPLPNLQRPGEQLRGDHPLTPIGFGPIPASWPSRQALGTAASEHWTGDDWLASDIPRDWNWAYFNVAPPDQQLDEICADERIVLEHLHPKEATIDTQLPGCAPCVFAECGDQAQRVPMKGDTLWIDTNRLVQTVTWRGQLTLEDPNDAVRVLVAMSQAGEDVSWDDVWNQAEQADEFEADYEEKTTIVRPKTLPPLSESKQKHLTSPVALARGGDHTPGWVPRASSPGSSSDPALSSPQDSSPSAPHSVGPRSVGPHSVGPHSVGPHSAAPESGLVVEIPLTDKETQKLRELCQAMGYDAVEMLRHALLEAHRARFG
jgi:hypothetical protein